MAFLILLNVNKICKEKKITLQDFLTLALICCIFHNVKNGRGGKLHVFPCSVLRRCAFLRERLCFI